MGIALLFSSWVAGFPTALPAESPEAVIAVETARTVGEVRPLMFGQFMEHEYKTIQGGLWAELVRNRKFERGDVNRDGVADGWVPEERIANRYWEVVEGQGREVRYFIDQRDYYGGGASQAIELYGDGSGHGSIYQIGLEVMKGRRYSFYAYLKQRGTGRMWVELERRGAPPYGRVEFTNLSDRWDKRVAEFTAAEDTKEARLRIGVEGHGTFWIDSVSLMPRDNLRGMRADVVEALRPLRLPILRYPGGCFADEYHWQNGIGPRDLRPEVWTDVWQEWDPNDFGTDEFMDLAAELGFQPHITANYASGTPEEAARWVEYANGSTATPGGALRARHGHPEPYHIPWWAVGNESARSCIEAYTGGNSIEQYVKRFQQFHAAMRGVDPSIRILAGGVPPGPDSWNRELLGLMPVDLLTITMYTGEYFGRPRTELGDLTYYYRQVVNDPRKFDAWLDRLIADVGDRFPTNRPLFAITEYNSFWIPENADADYRLANGLYLAGVFHALLRHTSQVSLAEWNTMINVQGLISVNPRGVKLTPPYFAYRLYRDHIGDQVLKTQTRSPAVPFNAALPALDAVATLSRDQGTVYLAVINRSEIGEIASSIELPDWQWAAGQPIRIWELNGKDRDAANPFGSTENVNLRESSLPAGTGPITYRFPAHSATILALPGKRPGE